MCLEYECVRERETNRQSDRPREREGWVIQSVVMSLEVQQPEVSGYLVWIDNHFNTDRPKQRSRPGQAARRKGCSYPKTDRMVERAVYIENREL